MELSSCDWLICNDSNRRRTINRLDVRKYKFVSGRNEIRNYVDSTKLINDVDVLYIGIKYTR